jgi:glutamine cyclotransferase
LATPTSTAAASVATQQTAINPLIGTTPPLSSTATLPPQVLPPSAPRVDGYRVIDVLPHDPSAYTQGLVYQDGIFFEGTGLHGQSTLRKVDPATGEVLQGVRLPEQYFGEGTAVLGDKLYQLTWQENTGFIYDKDTFDLMDAWTYPTEGWGLTTDGQWLIMSDGTDTLYFLDPATLEVQRTVPVFDHQGPVLRLNELEWVEGEVWANVWQTDLIARIDPDSGQVTGWVDLSGLLPEEDRTQPVDVLNGIAYDAATGRLFVTGKWWPKLFEIEVVPAP